jgi:hypothetical protein
MHVWVTEVIRSQRMLKIDFRRLSRSNSNDVLLLQKMLESTPGYAMRVTGSAVIPKSQAIENLEALPPDKDYDDKFFLAVYKDGTDFLKPVSGNLT